MRPITAALLAGAALAAAPLAAQDDTPKDEKWNVEAPRGGVIRQVPIATDEAT